jgi:hypothetical protein
MKLPEWIMLSALIVAAGSALAREPEHPRQTQSATQQAGAFERYDLDRNGKLSKSERMKHPMGAHAQMADANGDGVLDRSEFAALEAM